MEGDENSDMFGKIGKMFVSKQSNQPKFTYNDGAREVKSKVFDEMGNYSKEEKTEVFKTAIKDLFKDIAAGKKIKAIRSPLKN